MVVSQLANCRSGRPKGREYRLDGLSMMMLIVAVAIGGLDFGPHNNTWLSAGECKFLGSRRWRGAEQADDFQSIKLLWSIIIAVISICSIIIVPLTILANPLPRFDLIGSIHRRNHRLHQRSIIRLQQQIQGSTSICHLTRCRNGIGSKIQHCRKERYHRTLPTFLLECGDESVGAGNIIGRPPSITFVQFLSLLYITQRCNSNVPSALVNLVFVPFPHVPFPTDVGIFPIVIQHIHQWYEHASLPFQITPGGIPKRST
mmetsp:Transcript_36940/g.78010  ORF Transcript_36940/g.78010 Transcript_36940/m.78010 type:complete len:259 (+) Transcript_36940:1608-2384(+)